MSLRAFTHTWHLTAACAFPSSSSSSLARGRLIYGLVFHSFVCVPAVLRKEQRKVPVFIYQASQEVPFPQQGRRACGQANLCSHSWPGFSQLSDLGHTDRPDGPLEPEQAGSCHSQHPRPISSPACLPSRSAGSESSFIGGTK